MERILGLEAGVVSQLPVLALFLLLCFLFFFFFSSASPPHPPLFWLSFGCSASLVTIGSLAGRLREEVAWYLYGDIIFGHPFFHGRGERPQAERSWYLGEVIAGRPSAVG